MTTLSPYPGLRPFQQNEAYLFFGREAQVEDMLARLEDHRFLAVVGTSGCGKSSLVRAGLIPALEQGFLSDAKPHWRMAVMNPGSAPFDNLATALLREAALGPERQSASQAASLLQATLRRGPLGLVEAVAESHLPDDTNLLLVVDQFEEVFRYRKQTKNVNDADAFVNLLLASAQSRQLDVPIYVVITMRSDFIGDCALFTGLPETINDSQFLTPRLTRDQYRAAIVEPALVAGGQLTDALVNQLLNDLRGEPDQLPVLQHALMRMWTQVANGALERALTVDDYKAVGGLAGALSKHCDEILNDLNTEQQRIAEVMFRALCERSLEQRDTRRPVRLGEVAAIAGVDVEAVIPVVDAFRGAGRNFLMPPLSILLDAETTLDISHESLIRQWQTLNTWVAAEAESARQYQRLEDAAKRRQQRAGAELWRGVDLENARAWKEHEKPTEAWAARYGDAYQLAVDFLEESQAEAEKQARTASLFRAIMMVIGALLLVTISVAIYAFVQKREAKQQQGIAEQQATVSLARYFSAVAAASIETQPTHSILMSIEAIHVAKIPEAEGALRNAIAKIASRAVLVGHEGPVYGVAFSPDGQVLATRSEDGTVRLWSLSNPTAEPRVLRGHEGPVYGVAFSPNGQDLATASQDGTVRLWSLSNPTAEPRVLRGHEGPVGGVALAKPRVLRGHEGSVYGVAFSPDGQILATAGQDQTVRLWSMGIDDLIQKACRLTGGNFSYPDWQEYLGSDESYRKTCRNRPLHPSFLKSVREQVKKDDVKGGVAKLHRALQVDGDSDRFLQEARRLAALGRVDKGQELARQGDIDEAVGAFTQARELDPTLTLDPGKEARRLAAPGLVDKGRKLAKQGAVREAIAAFAAAQASDPNLEIAADAWNSLCWDGSLAGFATDVMAACERAVALQPDNGGIRDSRGVARVLTEDYPGAIKDFQQYLEWGQKNGRPEELIRQRLDWIRKLQANQNPFNEELLKRLRDQSNQYPFNEELLKLLRDQ